MPDDDLELTEALKNLRERHGCRVSYQRLWAAAVNGLVPARRVGGRWRVEPGDLPTIAAVMSGSAPPGPLEPIPAAA